MKTTKKPNQEAIRRHVQKLVSDGKATCDLPRELNDIYKDEDWKEWTDSKGQPFKDFVSALTARQPYGLGLGQFHDWINAAQLWTLCTGYPQLRKTVLPLAAGQVKAIADHGAIGKGRSSRDDIIISKAQGTSAEYLLGRIKRDRPDILKRLESGELTSIRKAAIAAGIVKVKDSDRDRSPVDRIKMYWKRATESEKQELIEWLTVAEKNQAMRLNAIGGN